MNRNPQIQSLDRELELLKRKREMIQRQWDILEQEKNLTMIMEPPRGQNVPRNPFPGGRGGPRRPPRAPRSTWGQGGNTFGPGPSFSPGFMQPEYGYGNFNNKPKSRGRKRRVEQTEWQDKFEHRPNNVSVKYKSAKQIEGEYVLRADKEPSVQIMGRLELGLGSLLKELRTSKTIPNVMDVFRKSDYLKALKTELRDRIKSTMMGKNVASLEVVIENYRAEYPQNTDVELISEIKRTVNVPEPIAKFNQMIDKKINLRIDALIAKLLDLDETNIGENETSQVLDETTEGENNESGEKAEENGHEANATAELDQTEEPKDTPAEENQVAENEAANPNEAGDESKPEASGETTDQQDNEVNDSKNEVKAITLTEDQLDAIDKIINKKLYKILTQNKKKIIDFVHHDSDFLGAVGMSDYKAEYTKKTPRMYFVRIMGKPGLPPKPLMQEFFEKFKTVSIKIHNRIPNLLFVGLKEIQDMEELLAATGTVIDGKTLEMKVTNRTQEMIDNNAGNDKTDDGQEKMDETNENGENLNDSENLNDGDKLEESDVTMEENGETQVDPNMEAELLEN